MKNQFTVKVEDGKLVMCYQEAKVTLKLPADVDDIKTASEVFVREALGFSVTDVMLASLRVLS